MTYPFKKNKLSSNAIVKVFGEEDRESDTILRSIDHVYFVICNSCYWCVSYFGIDDLESLSGSSLHVLNCPVCNSHNTELMPISTDESFRMEYSLTEGWRWNSIGLTKLLLDNQPTTNEQHQVPIYF
jgi:hypothetical protein